MKILVAGVFRMSGVSHKSGSPRSFDMTQLVTLQRVEDVQTEKLVKGGHGYEPGRLDCKPEVLPMLKDVRFPAQLEVEIELQVRGGNQVPLVVSAAVVAPARAAA